MKLSQEIEKLYNILNEVHDPEIPILSIKDIGILRDIKYENELFQIIITPTYSGCPAMYHIEDRIKEELLKNNISNYIIKTQLTPPWTTDWMTKETKLKLKQSGIAPPQSLSNNNNFEFTDLLNIIDIKPIQCPFCDSTNTKVINEFGSTACKSLHYCNNCLHGFDYFKCH